VIEVAEIVLHEANEPDIVADLGGCDLRQLKRYAIETAFVYFDARNSEMIVSGHMAGLKHGLGI